MIRQTPKSTRTDTHCPYTTLCRSPELFDIIGVTVEPLAGADQFPADAVLADALYIVGALDDLRDLAEVLRSDGGLAALGLRRIATVLLKRLVDRGVVDLPARAGDFIEIGRSHVCTPFSIAHLLCLLLLVYLYSSLFFSFFSFFFFFFFLFFF